MFGEEMILGSGTLKIDKKNRLCIPKKATGIDNNDEAMVIRYKEDYIEIYSAVHYKTFINRIQEKIDTCQDITTLASLKLQLIECLSNDIALVKVDSVGRIGLPKYLSGIEDSSVYWHGFYDHLRIYASEEAYKQSIEKEKQQLKEKTKKRGSK